MFVKSKALLSGTVNTSLVPSKDNAPPNTLLLTTEPDTATLTVAAPVELNVIFPDGEPVDEAVILTYTVELTVPLDCVKVKVEA